MQEQDKPAEARRVRIPLSQEVVKGTAKLQHEIQDLTIDPSVMRLIEDGPEPASMGDELTRMGEIIVEENGGSLRTFSGGLNHENGWWASYKRQRLQHWEGMSQRGELLKAECAHNVIWAQSEACAFRFPVGNRWFEYYCDILIHYTDGREEIIEVKRDDRALEDEDYRIKLVGVAEICRRIGKRFRLVMAEDIFVSRHHEANIELFASRRFGRVDPRHIRCLERLAERTGGASTYGELARALEPDFAPAGKAVIQTLVAHRRVEIDLTDFLTDETSLVIH